MTYVHFIYLIFLLRSVEYKIFFVRGKEGGVRLLLQGGSHTHTSEGTERRQPRVLGSYFLTFQQDTRTDT